MSKTVQLDLDLKVAGIFLFCHFREKDEEVKTTWARLTKFQSEIIEIDDFRLRIFCGDPPNAWKKSKVQAFGGSNPKCSRNAPMLL